MDDLLREFLTETAENLSVLDVELVKFEQNPSDAPVLGNIFRLVHTIKGTCGFLGLPRLEAVAHAGENVLGRFREGSLEVTPEAVTLILQCIDCIRGLLERLEVDGAEPDGTDSDLIGDLNTLAAGRAVAPDAGPSGPADEAAPAEQHQDGLTFDDRGFPVAADLLAEVAEALANDTGGDVVMRAEPAPAPVALPQPAPAPAAPPRAAAKADTPAEPKEAKESSLANASIRVTVDVLENLMTLVSELVLTRNQLSQMVRGQDDSEFKVPLQRLSHITSDLQEGVMKTRMQPIGNAWAKLPRIVRDLGIETGKKIELDMQGAETELDRQVLELIKDPLTHMVRNSADHGIEGPADRALAGKSEAGTITLKAYHEGGHIIILIADDGRGLNADKIRAKALANGLATESELAAMSEQQVLQFIFKAGFSTAEKVTNVSGRGVGMDVVRTNVEKIGGAIELRSVAGKGTMFTIKIPLTLAIVSALVVAAGKERFAVPQINVLELVRASAKSNNQIEMINAAPVLRLRDRLLPLVSLRTLLKLDDPEQSEDRDLFIVVAQVGTYSFGIIVDRVFDTEEIVVKPVSPLLRDIPFYSGNTILGDGSVIMILDPNGIASAVGQAQMAPGSEATHRERSQQASSRAAFIVFQAGGNELKAVPLALVARLEEIDAKNVEVIHGSRVVQYRGKLVPLLPFNPAHEWRTEGAVPVLVFVDGNRTMGLVVDKIVDIVEDNMHVELSASGEGLIGSAVIAGRATDVIDAGHFLTLAFTDWFGTTDEAEPSAPGGVRHVLLVDDSQFFRNLLTPVLTAGEWVVSTAENADEALKLLDGSQAFDAIISDIEMPGRNGFEFAAELRANPRWASVPLIALSSRASEADIARGREAGFSDYVAKTSRGALLASLERAIMKARGPSDAQENSVSPESARAA